MANNTLEAVFHRKIKHLSRTTQAEIMSAFRAAQAESRPGVMELEVEHVRVVHGFFRNKNSVTLAVKMAGVLDELDVALRRYRAAQEANTDPTAFEPKEPHL